ncbi:MAG TPA: alpha-amylase/4-alpha-glucanotransferase domain-containing protein [Candidatus Limnocylindrales bacterium]|nr:alpha-amylase/4-alpha-glucanotransferase domain-containing protein [Candidatus Limnocylindrales bacterium]
MPPRISLALAIHNHQPVGNFGWVFGRIHDQAYRPMLDALERHPTVRLSLHYSGALLEWLRAERPEFVDRLRALVDRDQVELLGGGYFEPVLASLPERDRIGQLNRMADEIASMTGRRPKGAWLAERVWEPDLPTCLAATGYRWTILDDAHFRAAAIPEENLWGAYTTEDQGHLLTVFGTEQGLRYRIPFGEVDDVIAYLREHATDDGTRVGMMGDDGEKFGAWPTTYEHCWGAGRWVDRFFEALEANASWLTTVTPSDWLEREPPIGRVYVPTSSYAEMGEWALPADEGARFGTVVHDAVAEHRPEARWLRGGFWRNFQVKYREVNDLHKQMLRASDAVAAMPPGRDRDVALDHLYRGQSNDCYWHGLFGGIYIPHMRLATFEHLIAAEDLAATAGGDGGQAVLLDADLDGRDEVVLVHPGQFVTADLDEGGGIGRWDVRAARHALAAVMRRRPEAYHATLREHEARDAAPAGAVAAALATSSGDDGAAPASIHDVVRAKESNLASHLHYDAYERRSGLVRILGRQTTPDTFAAAEATELGDFVDGPFVVDALEPGRLVARRDGTVTIDGVALPVRVEKRMTLGGDRESPSLGLEIIVENRSSQRIDALLGVEWAVTMLGGGANPAAWWEAPDGTRTRHDAAGMAKAVARIAQGNDYIGASVLTTASPTATAWWSPIETISNSESGFERVYQGSVLLLTWRLRLAPSRKLVVRVDHLVETTRDRAAEEAAAPRSTPA